MPSECWDEFAMTALALSACVRSVVRREAARAGSIPFARAAIARRYKLSPGTIENAERGRSKRMDHRLVVAIIQELQAECARMNHEIQLLQQMGAHPEEIARAIAHLRDAKQLLALP